MLLPLVGKSKILRIGREFSNCLTRSDFSSAHSEEAANVFLFCSRTVQFEHYKNEGGFNTKDHIRGQFHAAAKRNCLLSTKSLACVSKITDQIEEKGELL